MNCTDACSRNCAFLVKEPVNTVRKLYEYFGYEFDAGLEKRILEWLAENRQHKHGVHRYSLEQFGLDRDISQVWFRYQVLTSRFSPVLNGEPVLLTALFSYHEKEPKNYTTFPGHPCNGPQTT